MKTSGFGLLNQSPEDLPPSDYEPAVAHVVFANAHEPDEAARAAARNPECSCRPAVIQFLVVLMPVDLLPVIPVKRRLDQP
jgi:hypothetical protein